MTVANTGQKKSIDRRSAILDAAFQLAVRDGLTNVTTSAISRAAGIAAGTLFIYFDTKEALFNALYCDLVEKRWAGINAGMENAASGDRLETFWYTFARWYLQQPDITRVIQQCEVSSVLTADSLARREHFDELMRQRHFPEAEEFLAVPLRRQVIFALLVGPIYALADMRDKGEIDITDRLLRETFQRVVRAVQD